LLTLKPWASEGRLGGPGPPWISKFLAKKVVFSISRDKNQISTFLVPPWKTSEKSFNAPPGKNLPMPMA